MFSCSALLGSGMLPTHPDALLDSYVGDGLDSELGTRAGERNSRGTPEQSGSELALYAGALTARGRLQGGLPGGVCIAAALHRSRERVSAELLQPFLSVDVGLRNFVGSFAKQDRARGQCCAANDRRASVRGASKTA